MTDKNKNKPPFSEEEISVTVKVDSDLKQKNSLKNKEEVSEVSGISQKLEQIESQIYEENTQSDFVSWMNQTSESFFKSLKNFRLPRFESKPRFSFPKLNLKLPQIPKKFVVASLAGVVVMGLIYGGVSYFKSQPSKTVQTKLPGVGPASKGLSAKPLKLSVLQTVEVSGELKKVRRFKPRDQFFVQARLLDWNYKPGEKTEVGVDIRVYGPRGKLLYFQPDRLHFKSEVDPKEFDLLIQPKIILSPQIQPGPYRVMLTIREKSTNRQVVRQTLFSVVPK